MDNDTVPFNSAPDGYKYMPCKHCEKPILVGITRRRSPHHPECGMKALRENMEQISRKEGPAYERWLNAMRKSVENLGGGGPPPV